MAYCCGRNVYANFCDLSRRYNCFGNCDDSASGIERRFAFCAHSKPDTFMRGTIKIYVEQT